MITMLYRTFAIQCLVCLVTPIAGAGELEPIGKDLSAWQGWQASPVGQWKIVGAVSLAPGDPKAFQFRSGAGILVNGDAGRTVNIFTKAEHADVAAHVEFMVPQESNSGVYFCGRYELQILDSWDAATGKPKENPTSGDCGGIYERWDSSRGAGKEGYEGVAPGPTPRSSRANGRVLTWFFGRPVSTQAARKTPTPSS